MAAYDVTCWKDFTSYATATIEAPTAAAAIEIARKNIAEADGDDWTPCDDGGQPVHYIEALPNEDTNDPALDHDDPAHTADWLALSAPSNTALIQAARRMFAALNTAATWIGEAQRRGGAAPGSVGAMSAIAVALEDARRVEGLVQS